MIAWLVVTSIAIALLGLLSLVFKTNFWVLLLFYFIGIATSMLLRKTGR